MKKFLRKNLIGIIAVVLLVACGGAVFGSVSSQEPDRGDNPLFMENADHKEVFPEGKGYSLSKAKAKEYQLPEKNQQQESPITGSASDSFSFSSSGFNFKSSSSGIKFNPIKIDMSPTITTKLEKTQKAKTGEELDFYLEIKLYGKTKLEEKDYDLVVKYGGKTLKGKQGGSSSFSYTVTVLEGANNISASLTDLDKKKTTKAEYEIVGVDKKEETYKVESSGGSDTFENCDFLPYSVEVKKGESVKVNEIVDSILGNKYRVNSVEKDRITSISGFGNSLVLNDKTVTSLKEEGFTEDVDFYRAVDLTDADGTVMNDGIFPEGSSLTGTWKILIVDEDGEELKEVNYSGKNSTITIKENTTVVLRYVIE